MRLSIDISSIPFGTGVSRYTTNLVRALVPLLDQDELVLFGSSLRQKQQLLNFCATLTPAITQPLYTYPPSLTSFLFNSLHLPVSWFTGPVDVFHAWDWQVPKVPKGALVSTVHDLAQFKFPETAHEEIKTVHTQTLKYLKSHATRVIAVSTITKTDLVELFQFDPDKIKVIPEALPTELTITVAADQSVAVRKKYQLQKPYFLMVGAGNKRKNFENQYNAWLHYRSNFDLVVTGDISGLAIKPAAGLKTLGYVGAADLAALYQGAAMLLYVSRYEGFGLPILEAFYHHCPVVTGNGSGMAEVAGPAATYADPDRPESIMMAIGKAIQTRDTLLVAGIERLRLFSWDTIARSTLDVYHQAYEVSR